MGLIKFLKGVFRKMIVRPETIEEVLKINPTVSSPMKDSIELWESMYKGESPWLDENTKSLGVATMIASEKARTATLEMDIKITGESKRAKYISEQFQKVIWTIRTQLEYGIALGGLVIKPYVVMGPNNKFKIEVNYTKATHFYPLSFSPEGKITEAAFIDRFATKDAIYSKLEHHKLQNNTVTVTNMAYKKEVLNGNPSYYDPHDSELGYPIALTDVDVWRTLVPQITIPNMDSLLFVYFKMPQANNVDLESPLGVSGFSKAVDLIQDADKAYSNLLWEFEGGQMAIDVDRTCFNLYRDDKGKDVYTLPKLQDRLFRRTLDLGDDNFYNVFAPELRDKSILNELNSILVQIENVCDMSRGSLANIQYTEARTATEIKILKQRSFSANQDIQKELENCLKCVIHIMDFYCDMYQIVEPGDYQVAFKWDDSIIIDKDSERQVDLLDVQNGILSKVEYRMKWMGETEQQATEAINKVNVQREKDIEIESKRSENQTTLERSNDSNKITKNV